MCTALTELIYTTSINIDIVINIILRKYKYNNINIEVLYLTLKFHERSKNDWKYFQLFCRYLPHDHFLFLTLFIIH